MREFLHNAWATDTPKGTYNVVATTQIQRSVRLACPECGKVHVLADHHISPEGNVTPAILCKCGFHESALLKGWTEPRPQVSTAMRPTGG